MNLVNLDLDFLARNRQPNPDPWGTSQPHNTYQEMPWYMGIKIGHETRLESGQIKRNVKFHESLKVAPTKLNNPKYMVTMDTLKKAFGSSWEPDCPDLNEFEQRCKDEWKRGVVCVTILILLC